jgi:hypothetical protein
MTATHRAPRAVPFLALALASAVLASCAEQRRAGAAQAPAAGRPAQAIRSLRDGPDDLVDESRGDPDVKGKVPAPRPGVPTIDLKTTYDVEPGGNGKAAMEFRYPPAIHAALRSRLCQRGMIPPLPSARPTAATLVRYFNFDPGSVVLEDVKGEYGDETIRFQARELGLARVKGGKWTIALSTGTPLRLISKERSRIVTLYAARDIGGLQTVETAVVRLPAGARQIEVTEKPNELRYLLPEPKPGRGTTGRANLSLKTKEHLLGALYKLYGDPRFSGMWAARSVFHNGTGEVLSNYRVRFRLAGFSEWSGWKRTEKVYPGQTVVDPFKPLIDAARVQALTSATPVDVVVEYEYTGPDGKIVRDSDTERTKVLGMNEGVFSEVPLSDDSVWVEAFKDAPQVLGSFVAPKDPVIRETASLVSRSIGGRGAALSDEDAKKFLEGLYNLMRHNIAYETTAGNLIDGRLHQVLKYGRDVLRSRSGTCVNTSILFASVAEAAGLDAFIVVVPGHAYAGVVLPKSRKPFFVETTGCGDGKGGPRGLSYAQACDLGAREFERDQKRGLMMFVNLKLLRGLGVTAPELPQPAGDGLKEWGIRVPAPAEGQGSRLVLATAGTARIVNKAVVTRNGVSGAGLTVRVKVTGAKGKSCRLLGIFLDGNRRLIRTRTAGYNVGGYLAATATVTPTSDEHEQDVVLFVPFAELPGDTGRHTFHVFVTADCEGRRLLDPMPSTTFTVTRR